MNELVATWTLGLETADAGALGVRSSMPVLLIVALPFLGFVLSALFAAGRVRSKLPAWTTVACLAGAFLLTLSVFRGASASGWERSFAVVHGFDWFDLAVGETLRLVGGFSFYLDALSLTWMLFVTLLAALIALYASEYMSHDLGVGYCRFFAAFSLFVFSMSCLVLADNFLLLYLGWEGVGLCSYLLIGYFYKKPSAVAAAKKAFIVNRIGDLFLALGVFLTFVHFGSVEYSVVFAKAQTYLAALKDGRIDEIPLVVQTIPLLLMGGAFGKSAQLPLYVWLPDAMEGPTPVSALIHAATMVTAGVYLVARQYPLFLLSSHALPVVAWVGALTALLAATIGMAQFDIKRIMAYSTVSQLGYMFAGLGVLSSVGGVSHVVTHAFFKAVLFLSCGAVMHGFGGQLDLRKLSGVMKMKGWGVVGLAMLVGCLNLAGFPFTSGFFSKDMILAEAFVTPGMAPIGWVLLLTAGLTAYYTFRVFFRVFLGPEHFEMGEESHGSADHAHGHDHAGDHAHAAPAHSHAAHPHPPGWAINTVLAIIAVLSIVSTGMFFTGGHEGAVGSLVQRSTAQFQTPYAAHESGAAGEPAAHNGGQETGHGAHAALTLTPMCHAGVEAHAGTFLGQNPHEAMYFASGVVGAIGIVAAFWFHLVGRTSAARSRADDLLPALGPIPRWAQGKWFVDELYDALIVRPLRVLAHVFQFIDKMIVDGIVDLCGLLPRALGGTLRPSQSGELHGYAFGMAGGVALLLAIVLWVSML